MAPQVENFQNEGSSMVILNIIIIFTHMKCVKYNQGIRFQLASSIAFVRNWQTLLPDTCELS